MIDIAPTFFPTAEPCHGPSCILLMAREEAKLLPIFLLEILIATIQQGQQDGQQHDGHEDHDHGHAGDRATVLHRDGTHIKDHHHPKQQHAVQQIAGHDSPGFEEGHTKEIHLARPCPPCLLTNVEHVKKLGPLGIQLVAQSPKGSR